MTSEEVEQTKENNTVPDPPSKYPSLPDEITENILARVSRWKYPSLSLVSKRFHSLLSSMEIYKTRSQIGTVETCVYILLKLPDHPYSSWFSLRTKPNNQNRTKPSGKIGFNRDSSGFSVAPIPSSSSGDLNPIGTVGPEIYITYGSYNNESSSVRIFDCRSHTWRDAPDMTVARRYANTVLLDEKIYVFGGCNINEYYANWIDVFDIKTQSWSALPGPGAEEGVLRNHLSEYYNYIVYVFQGKIYVETADKDYTYDPQNGTWEHLREKSSFLSDSILALCEMGNVIYCCTDTGDLKWSSSDIEGIEWKEIKGLEELHEHPTRGLKKGFRFGLVGCGGQLLVMWDPYRIKRNKIWYAKISLESRCNGSEMWGNVECVDVLTFPVDSREWFECVAASV